MANLKPYVLFPEKKYATILRSDSDIGDHLSDILGDLQHWNNLFDFSSIDSNASHASKSSTKTTNVAGLHHPPVTSHEFLSTIKALMISEDGSEKFENLLNIWILHHKYYLVEEIVLDSELLCTVAKDCYGVNSVMKLIECAKNYDDLSAMLASSFETNALEIMKHPVAFQIVACCLVNLRNGHAMFLFNAASKHCVKLAKHDTGSDSLRQIFLFSANIERVNIMVKILNNSVSLAKHPIGSHVLQFVLDVLYDHLPFSQYLCDFLVDHLCELATHQYGSYVIEKCIRSLGGELIIESLLERFDVSEYEKLATSAYGNYVLQTAIDKCKGTLLHGELMDALGKLPRKLTAHAHARNVLKYVRRHHLTN